MPAALYQDPYDVFCSGNCADKIHFARICCGMSIVRFASEIETDCSSFFRLLKEYRSPGYRGRISKIREKMGLKRKEFAAIIGVVDQTVYHWEKEAVSRGSYICPGELTFYCIWKLAKEKGIEINES